MNFADKDASTEHQLWAMQFLAGTWNDYEGGFPVRGSSPGGHPIPHSGQPKRLTAHLDVY